AEPCGECETCQAIDAGRYIDLLEIDAASNTGVDNVRDLIENAQYMPSRGRYKVYLIDEVHMLSKPAFNALLKTLEEPPAHVKFLFATTDPEKLLVTVLSRCLQFNLKRLDEDQIAGQVTRILEAEGVASEPGAVRQIARAADGSLRDGLSLLDEVATLAGFSPDWGGVLDALAEALHRIQVRQLVPEAAVEEGGIALDRLAQALRPELVQLWYQMALNGRRDLPLAPGARAGFEMVVLRMLAFRPADAGADETSPGPAQPAARGGKGGVAAARAALAEAPAGGGRTRAAAPRAESAPVAPAAPARIEP